MKDYEQLIEKAEKELSKLNARIVEVRNAKYGFLEICKNIDKLKNMGKNGKQVSAHIYQAEDDCSEVLNITKADSDMIIALALENNETLLEAKKKYLNELLKGGA